MVVNAMSRRSGRMVAWSLRSAKGRQANAGCFKPAICGDDLAGDKTCLVRAQEMDDFGDFIFSAITAQRHGIEIGRDDFRRMHRHRQFGFDRAGADAIGANAIFAKFGGLLFGHVNDCGL